MFTSVLRSIFHTGVAALHTALLTGCVMPHTEPDYGVWRDQRAAKAVLERQVIPQLLATMTPEERRELGPVSATVTASADPTEIELRYDERHGSRLTVSTSFLALQNALVDSSVIASATTGHEQQVVDYSVMIARLALRETRTALEQYPEPFWRYMGWSVERHEFFSSDPRFEALRQRATMQSLAWLAASLFRERLSVPADGMDSQPAAQILRQSTADLLLRARIAPVPAWEVAILLVAIRHPTLNVPSVWICGARDVLETAIIATEQRNLPATTSSTRASREPVLSRWRHASQMLQRSGMCDLTPSGSGVRPSG